MKKINETKYASSVAQFHNLEAEYVKLDLNRVDPDLIKKIIYFKRKLQAMMAWVLGAFTKV